MTTLPSEAIRKHWHSGRAFLLTVTGMMLAWPTPGNLLAEGADPAPDKPAGLPQENIPPPIPVAPIPPLPSDVPPRPDIKRMNPLTPGEPPPAQPITKITETQFKMGEIEFDTKERTLTFPARVNMNQGNLEYLLVAEHGKVHEALLATPVQPFYLNVVLLLMKFEKVENFFPDLQDPKNKKQLPKPVLKETNSFECKLSWKDQDGKMQTSLLTDWIHNTLTKKPAPAGDPEGHHARAGQQVGGAAPGAECLEDERLHHCKPDRSTQDHDGQHPFQRTLPTGKWACAQGRKQEQPISCGPQKAHRNLSNCTPAALENLPAATPGSAARQRLPGGRLPGKVKRENQSRAQQAGCHFSQESTCAGSRWIFGILCQ